MQTADALVRVAAECAEDLAADGVVYAEVRFAPELHVEAGLDLDAVVEAVLEGFRQGSADGRGGRPADPGRLPAHRDAARRALARDRRAGGALPRRRRGRLRHRRGREGLPADPPPRRVRVRPPAERARHDPRRRGVRAAVDLGGDPVVRGAPAGPRRADRRRHHPRRARRAPARPAGRVRPRHPDPAGDVPDVERPHGCRVVDRRPPDRPTGPAALPGDGQHRQPPDVGLLDDQRAAHPRADLRLRLGRPALVHDQRDEVGVLPLRLPARR